MRAWPDARGAAAPPSTALLDDSTAGRTHSLPATKCSAFARGKTQPASLVRAWQEGGRYRQTFGLSAARIHVLAPPPPASECRRESRCLSRSYTHSKTRRSWGEGPLFEAGIVIYAENWV